MSDLPVRTVVPVPRRRPTPDVVTGSGPELLWREVAGAALRERRLASGRTLRQVADRAGLSAQYLSEIERGRKEPSSEMLESIAGALGWRLADLLAAAIGGVAAGQPVAPAIERFTVLRLPGPGRLSDRPAGRLSGPVLLAS